MCKIFTYKNISTEMSPSIAETVPIHLPEIGGL